MATKKVWLGIANEGVAELRFTSKLASMKGNLSKGDIKNGFVVVVVVVVGVVAGGGFVCMDVLLVAAVVVVFVADEFGNGVSAVVVVVVAGVVVVPIVTFVVGFLGLLPPTVTAPVRFVFLPEDGSIFVPFNRCTAAPEDDDADADDDPLAALTVALAIFVAVTGVLLGLELGLL